MKHTNNAKSKFLVELTNDQKQLKEISSIFSNHKITFPFKVDRDHQIACFVKSIVRKEGLSAHFSVFQFQIQDSSGNYLCASSEFRSGTFFTISDILTRLKAWPARMNFPLGYKASAMMTQKVIELQKTPISRVYDRTDASEKEARRSFETMTKNARGLALMFQNDPEAFREVMNEVPKNSGTEACMEMMVNLINTLDKDKVTNLSDSGEFTPSSQSKPEHLLPEPVVS